jgi:hypothetical protein
MHEGRSERYTRIEIMTFSKAIDGREATSLQDARGQPIRYGRARERIKITLIEVPAENWGLCDGLPASETDLCFKVGPPFDLSATVRLRLTKRGASQAFQRESDVARI